LLHYEQLQYVGHAIDREKRLRAGRVRRRSR
jgi:hypothetical protein